MLNLNLKSSLFLKSLLNLAEFDGKFIGICKYLPSVLRLRSCVSPNNILRFITLFGLSTDRG